jgi:hypothetical protein
MIDLMNLFHNKPMPDAASPKYVGEMPDGAARVQRAAAISRTFSNEPPDGCYRCEQELYISFFFDGFGHDQKIDARQGTLSNIGRLFWAHNDDPKKGVYKRYYEGLGARLSDEPVTSEVLRGNAAAAGKDQLKNVVGDKINEIGTDPYKKAASAFRENRSTPGISLQDLAKESGKAAGEELSGKRVWEKITDWRAFVKGNGAGVGFTILAETVPQIRDSEWSAAALGTGVTKRVAKAVKDFKKIVSDAQQTTQPVKHIKIAVFGYDRGALVARTFATELLGNVCKPARGGPQYQGIAVECEFMGLFDSVSSNYADTLFMKMAAGALAAAPVGGIGNRVVRIIAEGALQLVLLAKRTLGAVDVPEDFKHVVHYVAAHELRFYKCVDSLRKSKSQARITEVVFPGTQPDIGGGARNGDGGKSNELAKLVARCMHQEAWCRGVPLLRLDQMAAQSQVIAREFRSAQAIAVNGTQYTVDDMFQAYLSYVRPSGPLEQHFMAHQKAFVSYLRYVYDTRRQSNGTNFSDRAAFEYQGLVDNSGGSFSPTLGVVIEQPDVSAKDIADPHAKELGLQWEARLPLPPLVMAFFNHVFHNTIVEPLNDAALNGVSYFMLRPVEDLPKVDTLPPVIPAFRPA